MIKLPCGVLPFFVKESRRRALQISRSALREDMAHVRGHMAQLGQMRDHF